MHTHSNFHGHRAAPGGADDADLRKAEQLANLRAERRRYASGIYRIRPDRLADILSGIDRDIERILASMDVADDGNAV